MVAFDRAAADFTPTMETDSPLHRVMRFTLVGANLGTTLQLGIQNPIAHE
jgi:hypothetical protein